MALKIPEGWKKIRKGTKIKPGDRFYSVDGWTTTSCKGLKLGEFGTASDCVYITRK